MKNICIIAFFCLLFSFVGSTAFASEEGNLEAGLIQVKIDDGDKKHPNQERVHNFVFDGSQHFVYVLDGIRGELKNDGYKCSIEDVSSDTGVDLRVVMLCKKKIVLKKIK